MTTIQKWCDMKWITHSCDEKVMIKVLLSCTKHICRSLFFLRLTVKSYLNKSNNSNILSDLREILWLKIKNQIHKFYLRTKRDNTKINYYTQ